MLDTDTKRRIDTARDILVGKVPDPKSQVEQITIALIYKFMDDMDAEAEELGGKRKFFTGDFARYGWAKLMSPGLGGHEMLGLYAEGITKMPENPGIPPLFREIFKNAYLPYRDPETLKAFLKIIDEFSYDHSERLGDAFEYLLSVLGSQGDAGQFRTPRHIIDFIVEVVDPKKAESVLDPACGTAGFLISSYKHILKANVDGNGTSTLTPDDKGRLARNFKGYDISPDMVRLSLVNLYLHGFTDPHIYEYDTLTSEERWNELADVILANPPFMSPKGGIKPHRRFSIQAKRSEVLFLDYIAEHLTPSGRAGIIVPEGIIFQSQGAYKDLRKILIQNALIAVVSLPAGCFNPYSGVKTSILFLDKTLARQSNVIAFFKVENDGFGLGAQRRAFEKNDLPQVSAELAAYVRALRNRQSTDSLQPACGLIVSKERIAANGDYNLSLDRYREGAIATTAWPMVALGDVTRRVSGGTPSKENAAFWHGTIPWVSPKDMKKEVLYDTQDHVSNAAVQESATSLVPAGTLLCVVRSGILKHSLPLAITATQMCFNQDLIALIPSDERLDVHFLFWILKARSSEILQTGIKPGVTVQSFHAGFFGQFLIPIPPLPVQKEIVAELDGYQKVINGARDVLDSYHPHIPVHPEWPIVTLGEVCEVILTGPFGTALHQSDYVTDGIPVINPQNIVDGAIDRIGAKMVSSETRDRMQEFCIRENDIVIGRRGEMGRCAVATPEMNGWLCGTGCFVIRLKVHCDVRFVFFQIASPRVRAYLEEQAVGVTMKNLNQTILSGIAIATPSLEIQQAIVAEIEAEQELVRASHRLAKRFEKKIHFTAARIWGEDTPIVAEA